jgi:RNA polymerase sigma-54 factor
VEGELERNPLLERIWRGRWGVGIGGRRIARRVAVAHVAPSDWQDGSPDRKGTARPADGLGVLILRLFLPSPIPMPRSSRSNWRGAGGLFRLGHNGSGGRDNSDYNLEAFVPVEITLVDHLARAACSGMRSIPVHRMMGGQYLIRSRR